MELPDCTCDPTKGREAKKGKPGICARCNGKFHARSERVEKQREDELDRSQLVDAELWLQAEIFAPKERVRAIHRDGKWYVYDGVEVHEFSEQEFKDTYEKTAQSCQVRKVGKEKRYEYN